MPAGPDAQGESTQSLNNMEHRLLLQSEHKKKTGKWGGGLMKRLFRRNKRQPQQLQTAGSGLSEENASRYFAKVKDGVDELDQTTVNLSFSGGSNPYSTDGSFEGDRIWKEFVPPTTSSTARGSDTSYNSDPVDTSTSFQEGYSHTESSFAQLDVSIMQKSYKRGTPVCLESTSITTSDSEVDGPFVFRTRSTLDQSRILEDVCPTGCSDHGMEVVLFDQDEDHMEDGIFMSFQSLADNEWRDPFHSSSDQNNFSRPIAAEAVTPKTNLNIDLLMLLQELQVPPSPALSQQSETSVTWVSHDDDDGDERPMKEIIFPNLGDAAADELFLDCETINGPDNEDIVDEPVTPRDSIVHEALFAQMDQMNADKRNLRKNSTNATSSASAALPIFWNSNGMTTARSAFTPQSASSSQQMHRLSPRRAHSDADPTPVSAGGIHSIAAEASDGQFSLLRISPSLQKTPSSAFLKRKSAFTGEDLLSQEAESFADFLEEGQSVACDPFPTPIENRQPQPVSANIQISTEERLLFAMTDSIDASEDDNEDKDTHHELAAVVTVQDVPVVEAVTSPVVTPLEGHETPVADSVDLSYIGSSTYQSYATTRTTSTTMFSKSLSDEDADDEEELTNNASLSYASSTSYAASTSRSGGLKSNRRRSGGVPQLPYCGVFIQEDVEEEEEDFDDLSLPSEDFSCQRESNNRHPSRRRRIKRGETPILDQVRNELLETVQDLAREGSSVVMSFLRPRS
jgi:hypothetical protein